MAEPTGYSSQSRTNDKIDIRESMRGDIEKQYGHLEVTITGGRESATESEKDIPVRGAPLKPVNMLTP